MPEPITLRDAIIAVLKDKKKLSPTSPWLSTKEVSDAQKTLRKVSLTTDTAVGPTYAMLEKLRKSNIIIVRDNKLMGNRTEWSMK